MRPVAIAITLCCAITLLACGDDGDDAGERSATPPPASAPAATATGNPDEPSAVPSGPITSTAFMPRITVTAAEGWRVVEETTDTFVIEHDVADEREQAWIGFFHVTTVREPRLFATEPAPEDVLAWLLAHPNVTVLNGPTETRIGGLAATAVEVSILAGNPVPLFNGLEADFRDRFRVVQIRTAGGQIMMAAGAFEWTNYDVAAPLIDDTLSSVVIE